MKTRILTAIVLIAVGTTCWAGWPNRILHPFKNPHEQKKVHIDRDWWLPLIGHHHVEIDRQFQN